MAYADSNYATDGENMKLASRGAILYGDSRVGWISRKKDAFRLRL